MQSTNDAYEHLKSWQLKMKEKPPTFKKFAKTIKIYKPKYKWQKILPFWILKLFVKPTSFYNCFPKAIDSVCDGEGNLTFSVNWEGAQSLAEHGVTTYREWQFEFSKTMGIPYHYLKEVGDTWFNLINGEGAKEFLKRS